MSANTSGSQKRFRITLDKINHYIPTIVAVLGFFLPLTLITLRETGLAESLFAKFSEKMLIPIGVSVLSSLFLITFYRQQQLSEEIKELTNSINDPVSHHWQRRVKTSLPDNLSEVFSHELAYFFDGLKRASTFHEIELKPRTLESKFIEAYRLTLQKYSGATFWATALATRAYWQPYTSLLIDFQSFIVKKGAMHRLFFVIDPEKLSLEECEVMLAQARIGVHIYVLEQSKADQEGMMDFFVVEETGKVSWEVSRNTINNEATTHKIVASFDPEKVKQKLENSRKLFRLARCQSLADLELAETAAKERAEKKRRTK